MQNIAVIRLFLFMYYIAILYCFVIYCISLHEIVLLCLVLHCMVMVLVEQESIALHYIVCNLLS